MSKLYELVTSAWDRDCQRLWTIFGAMSLINGGLVAALIAGSGRVPAPTGSAGSAIRAVAHLGGLLCILWFLAVLRMAGWIRWWERKLIELEACYFAELRKGTFPLPADFTLFAKRKGAVRAGLSTRWVGMAMPGLFLAAWAYIGWAS